MNTVTIELTDDELLRAQECAAQKGCSLEESVKAHAFADYALVRHGEKSWICMTPHLSPAKLMTEVYLIVRMCMEAVRVSGLDATKSKDEDCAAHERYIVHLKEAIVGAPLDVLKNIAVKMMTDASEGQQ